MQLKSSFSVIFPRVEAEELNNSDRPEVMQQVGAGNQFSLCLIHGVCQTINLKLSLWVSLLLFVDETIACPLLSELHRLFAAGEAVNQTCCIHVQVNKRKYE